jgi:hypothetical protein
VNATTALPVPLLLPAEMCRKEFKAAAVQAPSEDSTTEEAPLALPTRSELVPRLGPTNTYAAPGPLYDSFAPIATVSPLTDTE